MAKCFPCSVCPFAGGIESEVEGYVDEENEGFVEVHEPEKLICAGMISEGVVPFYNSDAEFE